MQFSEEVKKARKWVRLYQKCVFILNEIFWSSGITQKFIIIFICVMFLVGDFFRLETFL